ncbi:MAG: hypothetical protein ABR597_13580 [Bacteroidales bacterium]
MMYIRFIQLLVVFLIISFSLYGQKDYEKGYVVNLENDTLYGKIKDRKPGLFPEIYQKIRFKKEGSHFRKKYNPNQIIGYKAGERVYESIGIERESHLLRTRYIITPNSQKSFLRVVQKDNLSYYHWEYIDNESNTLGYIPLLHKEGRTAMVRATQGILGLKKKILSEYFSDCPELVRKIEKKEIRTPEDVLEFYGYLCAVEQLLMIR